MSRNASGKTIGQRLVSMERVVAKDLKRNRGRLHWFRDSRRDPQTGEVLAVDGLFLLLAVVIPSILYAVGFVFGLHSLLMSATWEGNPFHQASKTARMFVVAPMILGLAELIVLLDLIAMPICLLWRYVLHPWVFWRFDPLNRQYCQHLATTPANIMHHL